MAQVKIEKMELLTSADLNILCDIMEKQSGLARDQYATNSWGFPFIPFPEPRTISGRTRNAPFKVSHAFLGHPIYWIDPELTVYDRENETEEQWCIRMYYMILAFGLWWEKDDSKWIDYISHQGYVYEEADVQHYLSKQHLDSQLDGENYRFLTERDMRMPWLDMKEQYENIMAECESRLVDTVADFFDRQRKSLLIAGDIFGSANLESAETGSDSPGGWWDTKISPIIEDIEINYQNRFKRGEELSVFSKPLIELGDKIGRSIILMEESIAILSIPVLRTASKNSQDWSEMMTFLRIGQYQAIQLYDGRYAYTDMVTKKIQDDTNLMARSRDDIPSVESIYGVWQEDYNSAWKRLRLVIANYQRMQHQKKPFTRESALMHHLRENKLSDDMSETTRSIDDGKVGDSTAKNKLVQQMETITADENLEAAATSTEIDYSEVDQNLKEAGIYHGDITSDLMLDDDDDDYDLSDYTRGRNFG